MPASAIVSEGFRTTLAKVFARDISQSQANITRFKIGEGGSTAGVPNTPDATRTDLESEGEPLAGGGTATFTNGSATVTGSGTTFLADVSVGEWIKPGPDFAPVASFPESAGDPGSEYDVWGEVQSVDNDTQITLTAVYGGATIAGREVRKAAEPFYTFRKDFVDADVVYFSDVPAIDEITAIVETGEANTDQLGNDPEFFELGLFDANGVMLVYITVDLEQKNNTIQLNHIIQITY
jgi:hypothetical protein